MVGYGVVNTKGQVTIPADIRENLGILPGLNVVIKKISDAVVVSVVPDIFSLRGSVLSRKKMNIKKMEENFEKYMGMNK